MSPTGSKTGHPFLANGPRRTTRVGEPSRRSSLTLPDRVLRRGFRRSAVALANFCVRSGVSRSLPLSLSEHLSVISAVSNAELECPSEFRDAQAVARICVHVPPHRSTFPALSNRERLEAVDVPSFPAKGDSCSTAEVLSAAWNRCARGSLPLRSSTGPPTTRAPFRSGTPSPRGR